MNVIRNQKTCIKRLTGLTLALTVLIGCGAVSGTGKKKLQTEIKNRETQLNELVRPLMGKHRDAVEKELTTALEVKGNFYDPLTWALGQSGKRDPKKAVAHLNDLLGTRGVDYTPRDYLVLFYEIEYGEREDRDKGVRGGRLFSEAEVVDRFDLVQIIFKKEKMVGFRVKVSR